MRGHTHANETSNEVNAAPIHANDRKYKIIWHRVVVIGSLEFGAIYGVYAVFTTANICTPVFGEYRQIDGHTKAAYKRIDVYSFIFDF